MKRYLLTALCILYLLATAILPAAADAATITSISFSNANAVAEENLSVSGYGDKDSGYATSTQGGRVYASVSGTDLRKLEWSKGEYAGVGQQPVMTGGTKNPWGAGAYLEIRTSTVGYENITFSAKIGATNKGPRDYKLQFSTDGVKFKDVAGVFFTVPTNKTLYAAFNGVKLPAAAADCETLYIRITVASNMMVNGTAGLVGSTGGETAINNIVVSGDALPVPTTTSASTDNNTTVSNNNAAVTSVIESQSTTACGDTNTTTPLNDSISSPTNSTDGTHVTSTTSVKNVSTGQTTAPILLAIAIMGTAVTLIPLLYCLKTANR